MSHTRSAWTLALLLLLPFAGQGQVAPHAAAEGTCAPSGAGCDRAALQGVMKEANTVSTQAPSRDRFAQSQLNQLVKKLGKQVSPPDHAADVTLILTAPEPTGVDLSPGDRELATLRVFSGGTGKLIWVERLTGTGNRPWPAIVDQLLTQFKATLGSSGS